MRYPTKPFLEDALKYFNYRELSKKEHVGISLFILDEDTAPGESARIIVKDGKVHTYLGGNVSGQGHEMFVKSILSDELDIEQDSISLDLQVSGAAVISIGSLVCNYILSCEVCLFYMVRAGYLVYYIT